ncbi:MAG: sulfatase-like hydrolase/transferase [Saprospiraceae bacterium]|nr:sulfatase-like hydrolase/transferase [Saprospiraceae bacterium]
MIFLKYIKYFFFWVGYFIVARLIFVLYHLNDTQSIGFQNVVASFSHGIRLDLSAAGYFSVLPFLLFSTFDLLNLRENFGGVIRLYSFFLILVCSSLIAADLELFKNWGYRIDDTFLKYLLSPNEAAASISSYPVFLLFSIFIIFSIVSFYIFNRFVLKNTVDKPQRVPFFKDLSTSFKRIGVFFVGLLLTASLILPIRGGVQLAPVNQSAVYFSEKPFANYAAVNPIWNFFVSVFEKTSEDHNPYVYMPENEALGVVSNLFSDSSKTLKLLRQNLARPNILIVTYESLTAKVIEKLGGEKGITPQFDSLTKEGILFSNIYATGDRTDRGLVAVLSGYPAIPRANVMEVPRKSAQLPILSRIMRGFDYTTGFYYGGEAEFANMKSYLLNGQFSTLITKSDFQQEDLSSKWGAFDHVVFDKLLLDLQHFKQPFFVNILTQSSHEPFEIPKGWGQPNLNPTDNLDEKFRRVHFYSDQALGAFIRKAKTQAWWVNTLVVVIADHSSHHIEPHDDYFKKFHIPMLWLGGALAHRDTIIPQVGSQIDLAATVLGQLDMPSKDFIWSKNILTTHYQPFAYFAFQNGIGFVQKDRGFVFDTEGSFFLQKKGTVDSLDVTKGKAFLQLSYQDYLKK